MRKRSLNDIVSCKTDYSKVISTDIWVHCHLKKYANKFAFSLGLASLSSFSLATRTQASLVLARSCVSCTHFSDFVTEIRLHLRNTQINLVFRSICTHFSACFASPEDRRHLGKSQINLHFRSVCTIFAPAFAQSLS